MKYNLGLFAVTALGLGMASATAQAYTFDFETDGQYDAAFRKNRQPLEMNQTSNGAANDFLRKTGGSLNTASTSLLDFTPDEAADKTLFNGSITATFGARFSAATLSLGIAVIDPNNEDSALLALINVDNVSSTQESFRFFTGSNQTSTSAGAQAGSTINAETLLAASSTADFVPVTVDYSISGATPTMKVTVGDFTATSNFAAGTAINNPEFGLRLYAARSDTDFVDIDDLNVVPEPASIGLLGVGALGLLARRRRT